MSNEVGQQKKDTMTYEELAGALNDYFNAPMSEENFIFSIALALSLIIFLVWFVLYLRKALHKEQKETDNFTSNISDDLNYMGFNKNKNKKDDDDEGKDEKKEELKGGINDEY